MADVRHMRLSDEGFAIRRARLGDAPAVRRIYNDAVRKTTATFDTASRSLPAQRALIAGHGARLPFLVAEREGKVIGWGCLSQWSPRRAYAKTVENSVYVDEKARGQGVGKALLGRLLADGRKAKLHTVVARVAEGNPSSARLHQKAGFRRVGVMREVGLKFGRRLDVELLQIFL